MFEYQHEVGLLIGRMLDAKNVVHQLRGDEAAKEFTAYKRVHFNDPDVVPLIDITKFAVAERV